ncbi:hypothetical protein [Lignipirellula cremea]|uniref:Cytochrome c domain-containing protein n=1 Tax=Lignipirellula cremea TaxID=2528010 RepID=A0A518DU13_9BACT|nr:hypothetical protein [Lignipirellula cremea]QDU95327.1 hypothetical protein Pla8534_31420 [Lignipirellula cremea]
MTKLLLRFALLTFLAGGLAAVTVSPAAAQSGSIYIRFFEKASPTAQGKYLELIAKFGSPEDLRWLLDHTVDPAGFNAENRDELRLKSLAGLAVAAANNKKQPTGDLTDIGPLLQSENLEIRLAVFRLIGLWKLEAMAEPLQQTVLSSPANGPVQSAALAALSSLGGEKAKETFMKLAADDQPLANRELGIAGLAGVDLPLAAKAAAGLLATADFQEPPGLLMQGFLDQQNGSQELAKALQGTELSRDLARLMLRYLFSVGRNDEELATVLNTQAGITETLKPLDRDELLALAHEVQTAGDPARGEAIFRRNDLSCFKCHALSGAGGKVGPDLSAVGGSSPVEYVITSIMFPSQDIKEAYLTRKVFTLRGKVYQGVVVDRDDKRLILRDATGVETTIPEEDIDEEAEGKSLMPQGLPNFLTHAEFLDLAAFISQLGKPGPYAVRKEPTIQRWRVLREVPPALVADVPHDEIFAQQVLAAADNAWEPAYAMTAGALPLGPLAPADQPVLYLYGEVEAAVAGPVQLSLDSPEGVVAWIDGDRIAAGQSFELPTGKHRITLRVDTRERAADALRAVVEKTSGSSADFQVVGGP